MGDYDSFDEIDVYDRNDYLDESWYDAFGYGGYASQGYGYEGSRYDYYDDLYTGGEVYGGAYDYGVDEGGLFTEDWYDDESVLDQWYE